MRTIDQILSDMDAVQATLPDAAGLTSKSKTSVFGLLRNIWALFVQSLEAYVGTLQADLTTYVNAIQVGSIAWYVSQVKAFQFGDSLTLIDGQPGYAVIDPAKQIVVQCAVVETAGRLLIKVAKSQPGHFEYQALADGELSALREYVRSIKYAGVTADIISLAADQIKMSVTVQYDRQLLNANGQLLADTSRLPALEAISLYIRNLPFDSVFSWTALTDYCQSYLGVVDFVVTRSFIRPAGAIDWIEFTRETTSRAGHLQQIDVTFTYV